jgi:hypothetical protein
MARDVSVEIIWRLEVQAGEELMSRIFARFRFFPS